MTACLRARLRLAFQSRDRKEAVIGESIHTDSLERGKRRDSEAIRVSVY
jgi:hypothetical protein